MPKLKEGLKRGWEWTENNKAPVKGALFIQGDNCYDFLTPLFFKNSARAFMLSVSI